MSAKHVNCIPAHAVYLLVSGKDDARRYEKLVGSWEGKGSDGFFFFTHYGHTYTALHFNFFPSNGAYGEIRVEAYVRKTAHDVREEVLAGAGRAFRAHIPTQLVAEGLDLAEKSSYLGVPMGNLTRDELVAALALSARDIRTYIDQATRGFDD